MSSMPFIFSWEVLCAPIDEAQLENYNALQQEHSGDYLNVKVNVKHQLFFVQSYPQQSPSLIPFDRFSFHSSMFLPSQEFLENGPSYMQMHFPNPVIPNELIPSMMEDVVAYANVVIQNGGLALHYQSPNNFRMFNLVLDIFIQKLYDERDNDMRDMIMRESMREVEMVPASSIAIETLKKVKLEDNATMEKCSICLIEFGKDMEVSLMPCSHIYHEQCLIQWLQRSHMCPMCRYPMPTSC
ncbi:hypothetical protein RJT34_10128 [Clitoria ternatea]|uniref:RING-type E3 ubiquitin transferase n=1 Tax=Clitoria ternatea TaxID=43366 RepID=A0AAN9PVU3_CLITE